MIAVTGASGQLGQKVITHLLNESVPANQIVAIVRDPNKVSKFKELGIQVRQADYNNQASFESALNGVQKLLLISSNEIGKRFEQHKNVINAAKKANVAHVAYTSILKADSSKIKLAGEHKQTEEYLLASGLNYSFLRNGWYTENYTMNAASALEHKVVLGSAGSGRISSASRNDYALAAAKVLTLKNQKPKNIYELAGDTSFTLKEYAEELTLLANKEIVYKDLQVQEFEEVLVQIGLPKEFAHILADAEENTRHGDLYSTSKDLHDLIGRNTQTLRENLKSLNIV